MKFIQYRILDKAIMPDGTHIQIEDWSEICSICKPCDTLVTFPKVTTPFACYNTSDRVRIALAFENEQETRQAFSDLTSGRKSLKDFRSNANWDKRHYLDLI